MKKNLMKSHKQSSPWSSSNSSSFLTLSCGKVKGDERESVLWHDVSNWFKLLLSFMLPWKQQQQQQLLLLLLKQRQLKLLQLHVISISLRLHTSGYHSNHVNNSSSSSSSCSSIVSGHSQAPTYSY